MKGKLVIGLIPLGMHDSYCSLSNNLNIMRISWQTLESTQHANNEPEHNVSSYHSACVTGSCRTLHSSLELTPYKYFKKKTSYQTNKGLNELQQQRFQNDYNTFGTFVSLQQPSTHAFMVHENWTFFSIRGSRIQYICKHFGLFKEWLINNLRRLI